VDIDLAALPSDLATLHRLVRDLAAQVADDRSELAQAQAEIERLNLIIRRFQRAQFGRRSERIDGDQLALGLEVSTPILPACKHTNRQHRRRMSVRKLRHAGRDFPTICPARISPSISMSVSAPAAAAGST
jgi:hypothetical protein